MKKILLISFLFLNFLYSNYYKEQGTPISWNEFHLKMQYCFSANLYRNKFYSSGTYNEEWGDYDFNGLPLEPLELTPKSGHFALGLGEMVIQCNMAPTGYLTNDEEAPSCNATKNWHITEVNPHNNLNNSFITTIFKVQVQIYELFSIKTSV